MLIVRDLREALANYQWIVGEPIEERTFTFSTNERRSEPNTILTLYRVRVEKHVFLRTNAQKYLFALQTDPSHRRLTCTRVPEYFV